jgi:RadC-like JAB domain
MVFCGVGRKERGCALPLKRRIGSTDFAAKDAPTDRRLTRSVSLAASTMQIRFLDHLIMGSPAEGRAGHFSFKETGRLYTMLHEALVSLRFHRHSRRLQAKLSSQRDYQDGVRDPNRNQRDGGSGIRPTPKCCRSCLVFCTRNVAHLTRPLSRIKYFPPARNERMTE